MMDYRLESMLGEMAAAHHATRLRWYYAYCWSFAAGLALLILLASYFFGFDPRVARQVPLALGLLKTAELWFRGRNRPVDLQPAIAALEREYPHLRHLVSAAAEQSPNPESGRFEFLQTRVIEEVLLHRDRQLWEEQFQKRLRAANGARAAAFIALVTVWVLGVAFTHHSEKSLARRQDGGLTISPGDTEIERGSGLVITARFGGAPPLEAALVVVSASGKTKRLPLARQLADPVLGTSLTEVGEDSRYHIEYDAKKSPEYKISVIDFPALVRADASLHFPEYTHLPERTIRDTLRVSAIAGTRLTYVMRLNKPVATARFVGKTQSLTLAVQTNAVALLTDFGLTNSGRYRLVLTDADGRTNKMPDEFSVVVLPDHPPEVTLVFPRGDQRISSLAEMDLVGSAKAEFGLLRYGVGYSVGGLAPHFIELGQTVSAGEKRQFTNQISMEKLGVTADQLVSYFAWADDQGPGEQVRRTFSDMFFAEIRPFDEVFRADQSGEAENQDQDQNQGGGQGGNQPAKLAELQKQIVIATWKLQQEKAGVTSAEHP